jgi:hypothetical protein
LSLWVSSFECLVLCIVFCILCMVYRVLRFVYCVLCFGFLGPKGIRFGWRLRSRVKGLGLIVNNLRLKMYGVGLRVRGLGFRILSLRSKGSRFGV